jgi:hypothetical protein
MTQGKRRRRPRPLFRASDSTRVAQKKSGCPGGRRVLVLLTPGPDVQREPAEYANPPQHENNKPSHE